MRLQLLFLLMFLASRLGEACQCGYRPSALEALPASAAVFDGTVVRRTPFIARVEDYVTVLERYDFLIHQKWTGGNEQQISIVAGFSNCDFYFAFGTRYLVFARPSRPPSLGLVSSICLPTKPVAISAASLSALGPGLSCQPVGSTVVEPRLARLWRHFYSCLLWGLVTSASLVWHPDYVEHPYQARFLIGPLGGLVALLCACVLAFKARFVLLRWVAPLLFIAVILVFAIQGYAIISTNPMLASWVLDHSNGA